MKRVRWFFIDVRCAWQGHPLTQRMMEFVDRLEPPVAVKLGPWVPVSSELLADSVPFSWNYSLRCRCGKKADPTIRSLFDGMGAP